MSNSISWMGNRVVNPGAPIQTPQSGTVLPPPSTVPQNRDDDLVTRQGPPPSTERGFIPYYLASNIGKNVRAEFIIGTSQYADKTGVLTEVGINYFVLRDVNSRTDIMCDLYSVKFVTLLMD